MPDILHLLKIKASPERTYQALTTPEGIRNWWTRDADLENVVGGRGEFRFGSYGATQATVVEVTELVAPARVSWKVTSSFRSEWTSTTITFDLKPDPIGTVLRFAHRGFERADDIYALCTTGWGYYLVSLQQYLEGGQGAPSPDIDFARVLMTD